MRRVQQVSKLSDTCCILVWGRPSKQPPSRKKKELKYVHNEKVQKRTFDLQYPYPSASQYFPLRDLKAVWVGVLR